MKSVDHIMAKGMKVSQVLPIAMVGIILLVSCVYPRATQTVSPEDSPVTNGATNQPSSTLSPAISVSVESTLSQPHATATPQITPVISTPTPTPLIQVTTQYDLDAIFDYYQHTLSVSETISYVNTSPDTISELTLMVEPNHFYGSFILSSLSFGNGETITDYDLQDDQMHIPLSTPLGAGEELDVKINYQLEIPEIAAPSDIYRPLPYGYTERQTNLVDWYAYVPAYRAGEGWLAHPHWGFGEHQVFDAADFSVKITLAEPVENLVIAASAPAVQDDNRYSYHLEASRTFALSASTEYLVQTTIAGDVTIYSYSFPFDRYAGLEVLHNTADALELYSNLIAPYPRLTLSVVEADFLDGMEYEGLFFLSHGFYDLYDGTPKGYLTFIAAHETAHQWWYGLVGNDQALEPWLDEALCTYMERVFYENVYADYPPGSGESMVDWWWYYRVNFYHPSGYVDGSIYDFNEFYPYRNAVYLNGAKFLEDLRNLIGDTAFFAFLRDYAAKKAHGIATASGFFSTLRDHTTKNLDNLLTTYFKNSK